MKTLIIEMQDGMMCKNDKKIVKQIIDSIIDNDCGGSEIIFKWQLYTKIKTDVEVIPLKHNIFEYAYEYAAQYGYQTTASIFDKKNYDYLKQFKIPFIKIACQTDLYEFRKNMWQYINVKDNDYVISVENENDYEKMPRTEMKLCCVPKYPATINEYEEIFNNAYLRIGISDHTIGLELYNKYKPIIFEKHYYIDGLDSWDKDWAMGPKDIKIITGDK